jgi:hypothetical protein
VALAEAALGSLEPSLHEHRTRARTPLHVLGRQLARTERHLWARRLRWQVGRVAQVATRRSAASESFSDHAERYGWVSLCPDDRCSAREQDAEEQRPERAQTGERAEGRETSGGPGPGV